MAEPAPQRSLKRVWLWVLLLVVAIWIIYAMMGGPSTPEVGPAGQEPVQTQP